MKAKFPSFVLSLLHLFINQSLFQLIAIPRTRPPTQIKKENRKGEEATQRQCVEWMPAGRIQAHLRGAFIVVVNVMGWDWKHFKILLAKIIFFFKLKKIIKNSRKIHPGKTHVTVPWLHTTYRLLNINEMKRWTALECTAKKVGKRRKRKYTCVARSRQDHSHVAQLAEGLWL